MPKLNVNIDHVATLRQARRGNEPDPVTAAVIAELAGASGIVAHLREDRRHAQNCDLEILRRVVKTKLNMEMAATDEMLKIARTIMPDMVTLVPEKREEITTEGGLDVSGNLKSISKIVNDLKNSGIFVSLFIDPDYGQISASCKAAADMVEIHTGMYSSPGDDEMAEKELVKIKEAVVNSRANGLRVAAGHGLDYFNVKPVAEIEGIEELNIGHSIISRAIFSGMEMAVRDMIALCGD